MEKIYSGVDALSHKYGIVRLRVRVESSGFTALNEPNFKKAFVTKTAEGFQIQKRGSDRLLALTKKT